MLDIFLYLKQLEISITKQQHYFSLVSAAHTRVSRVVQHSAAIRQSVQPVGYEAKQKEDGGRYSDSFITAGTDGPAGRAAGCN